MSDQNIIVIIFTRNGKRMIVPIKSKLNYKDKKGEAKIQDEFMEKYFKY